jgi:hypothetical protein
MKHILRILNVFLIAFLLWLALVNVAFAQGNEEGLLTPFGPILAAAAAVERFLQLIRNVVSPKPDEGLLARGTKALRYYTTIGGVILGLVIVFLSDLRLLEPVGITMSPILDSILTGVIIGMGTEFVHEAIMVVGEGKRALRASGKR